MKTLPILILATCVAISPVSAQTVLGPEFDPEDELSLCRTSINGEKKWVIFEDTVESDLYSNYSFREIFLGGTENIDCPAYISLQILTPELSGAQRGPFCLEYDEQMDSIIGFSEGERDAYLICKEPTVPVCERVNNSKDAALALAGTFGGAVVGTNTATGVAGVSAVSHSSGALILTGNAGYIAGTLGTVGSSLVALLTAPATLAAAGVTLVVVGGAVYVCADEAQTE
ncbi:hypothetical protein [Roseovarius mucosus]|uniref:hypothetical protein n=1 Tax=Roseovarius mucosus TaxID=215743 RepID=UPI003BA9140B